MISCGINDSNNTVSILATRIFDNVRVPLDRTELLFNANIGAANATPIYFSGTGTLIPESGITVAPDLTGDSARVTGNIALPGTVTYLSGGVRLTTCGRLILPINAQLKIPEDSVWPFDITVHYSFFADNITAAGENSFNALTDGVVMIYVTACVPICLEKYSFLQLNDISSRAIQSTNNFLNTVFYPSEL